MRISQLIKSLSDIKSKLGDVPVYLGTYGEIDYSRIEMLEEDECFEYEFDCNTDDGVVWING